MARIETAFGLSDECSTPSPAPHARTDSAQQCVGSPEGMGSDDSDAIHERAIESAGLDVEHHLRLRDQALRDWHTFGDFAAKAEADDRLALAQQAAELMQFLILNRSPEQVARMLEAQAKRISMEPGAART